MRLMMTAALAALIVAGAAVAEPVKGRANVDDTSLTMPGGERVLRESIVINAPRAALWARFSTVEGLKSWEAPVVSIDLRTGGLMQASYDPKATLGDPSTIAHEIVRLHGGKIRVESTPGEGATFFVELPARA